MEKKLFILILLFSFSKISIAQVPFFEKMWDKILGGSGLDEPTTFQQTKDGGFIIGGWTDSPISFDVTDSSRGSSDYWIVKTDSVGNRQWDKRFGGNYSGETIESVQQTKDGGYIIGGYSPSGIGIDKTDSCRGSYDYWIIKLDSIGNKTWYKTFGGHGGDFCYSVKQTTDGGYLAAGMSYSDSSGDKTQNSYAGSGSGKADFWIIKIDSLGNKQWDKQYGGNNREYFFSLELTTDSGYLLAGYTESNWGGGYDVSQQTRGGFDYWTIKIDAFGNKLWDKRFGGSDDDFLYSCRETRDKGFILHGVSRSGLSGDKTQPQWGFYDYWMVKIDSLGIKEWDKDFGGTRSEYGFGLGVKEGDAIQTMDGGYLIGGFSGSNDDGTKSEVNLGNGQTWIVKTDSLGNKLWDKTLFTKGYNSKVLSLQTKDSCYVFANYCRGDSGAYKTDSSRGNSDFWLLKFRPCQSSDLPNALFTSNIKGGCANTCIRFVNYSDCYTSCQWIFPGGVPDSSTKPTQMVCYPDTGNFPVTLITYNSNGSDTLTLNNYVHIQKPFPVITTSGFTLISTSATNYQWYDSNGYIDTAYNQTFNPPVSGYYHVCVSDSLGCYNCSDSVNFVFTSQSETHNYYSEILISPNPTTKQCAITTSLPNATTLILYDIIGRVQLQQPFNLKATLDLNHLTNGVYILEIKDKEGKGVKGKIIKQ